MPQPYTQFAKTQTSTTRVERVQISNTSQVISTSHTNILQTSTLQLHVCRSCRQAGRQAIQGPACNLHNRLVPVVCLVLFRTGAPHRTQNTIMPCVQSKDQSTYTLRMPQMQGLCSFTLSSSARLFPWCAMQWDTRESNTSKSHSPK